MLPRLKPGGAYPLFRWDGERHVRTAVWYLQLVGYETDMGVDEK